MNWKPGMDMDKLKSWESEFGVELSPEERKSLISVWANASKGTQKAKTVELFTRAYKRKIGVAA
jgi:hypothetical protein